MTDTTPARVWTGRDAELDFSLPLCATREDIQAYAVAKWRENYADETDAEPTWAAGPARTNDNDGLIKLDVQYLEDGGGYMGISVYALTVHPDVESAQNEYVKDDAA